MATTIMPPDWHKDPSDSFHGQITISGPFHPEKNRYHLYIGLFCPFAHRANLSLHLKQLNAHAGITASIVRPYPLGDENGYPGWRFNLPEGIEGSENNYPGSTVDHLYGSKYMSDIYFRAEKEYKGRYSVPVLWDKKLNTIVNNESAELLRHLQTAFDPLLPPPLSELNLYPLRLKDEIESTSAWMQRDLNTGVYKAGFAPDQDRYNENVPKVFAALNKFEKLLHANGGPYILGQTLTILDVQLYTTLIRFDPAYVQHFYCNIGQIRREYPVLHNYMKNLYWSQDEILKAFGATTDFDHIKDNYMKSHPKLNPKTITPLGPWPHIEGDVEDDWSKVVLGGVKMPVVLAAEKKLDEEIGSGPVADVEGGFSATKASR
ncbi:hypothetical protein K431DRAFT_281272 [Polychaeton citri CBS 116435]|uniref:GST N-terminal domain-containing protein n=1 Tax=Polychaeton citri CBS 116435 TaxID=1314669 RepID=A0A9P4QGT9_9PEZI|nr:hypothetical protein K431DRAFT_281272 [Polychaeton citri CBS 116435]